MSSPAVVPLALGLGAPEILIILLIVVLLFGAKKLPELARGSGRALRIFKAETKGLLDDEDDDRPRTEEQRQLEAQQRAQAARPVAPPVAPPVERPVEHPAEQPRPDADR
ncbi:MAG: Sec-independent protein translocase subunit TatA [Nocardioides sp.]